MGKLTISLEKFYMKHSKSSVLYFSWIFIVLSLCCIHFNLHAQYTTDKSDKELEIQKLEKAREEMEARDERTRDSKASRSGFFRVWNFSDPSTERLSVVLKNQKGEVIPINRSLRPGLFTAYRLLPAEEYEIQLYRPIPVIQNEEGSILSPKLENQRPILQTAINLDLDPRTCQTLLILGSQNQLTTKILQDFDSDGQSVLRIINTLQDQPLSVSYGREPQLTTVVHRFEKGTTVKRLNLNSETDFHVFFQKGEGLSSRRITSLDYALTSNHSLIFHLDRYDRPTITSTRDGYRAALLDQ